MSTPTWTWQLEDPTGAPVDPAELGVEVPVVDNQGDAESWLGENWRDLLERGIATVTLLASPEGGYVAWAIQAPEIRGDKIVRLNAFLDVETLFPMFGLPLRMAG